jgi:hypothetical protein
MHVTTRTLDLMFGKEIGIGSTGSREVVIAGYAMQDVPEVGFSIGCNKHCFLSVGLTVGRLHLYVELFERIV